MATNNHAFPLTAIDREILAMKDEDFSLVTWEELKEIIAANRLEQLKRRPSDLRRYIAWSSETKAEYGTITNFVVQKRLHWTPLPSSTSGEPPKFEFRNPVPFKDQDDFRILRNDWPYGLDKGIVHICVWVKTPIETDLHTGDVTDHSRSLIEDFVNKTFAARLDTVFGPGKGKEHVLWFKNWVALQSVRGVDHIHVLVRDAPETMLEDWFKEA
ncbi:hypothetical protein QM012_007829 [Aureobasidium pullulans]|uniref:N-acetylglucosamine-induced protein 1 n=1 Tax=Aureobasidium pullulans TaxID=5580 RepID=A0ABR0TMB6_AURPU